MADKYQSTQSARFYPGAFMKPERAAQLLSMNVDIDEVSVDDRTFMLSNIIEIYYHMMLNIVHEKWGAEAARDVAHEFGYQCGKAFYQTQLTRWNTDHLDPEKMSMYQDLAHALLGSSCAHAFSTYDNEKCEVKRTGCFLYNPNAPEPVRGLCDLSDAGFLKGYMELDKTLSYERPKALPLGDDHCHHIFRYKKA